MKSKFKNLGNLCCLLMFLFVVSCANGIDDNERFSGGVTNAQLESPEINENCFSTLANSDGSESVKVTWPLVCDNSSAYFIRYSNSSNAQPKKIFGNSGNSSTFEISYNTFSKTMNGKDFANNLANTNTLVFNVHHNIFYDTYRLNKLTIK